MALIEAEINKRVNDSYEVENNVLEAVPTPLVSIRTSTYNHGPYIKQCIEGVLMQKTNFPFEYIIGEDCSTDETREIVFDYAKRYPNIIRVITANYNVGSKANGRRCINACRGKYMAICEGDDYWTDPLKLQKQVDFLEANPEYSMCFHRAKVVSENGQGEMLYNHLVEKEYSIREILKVWTIPTASVMFRTKFVSYIPNDAKFLYGDIVLFLTMASKGKLYCLGDKMSVYRRLSTGIVGSIANKDVISYKWRTIEHYMALAKYFPSVRNICYWFVLKLYLVRLKCILYRFCGFQ